MSFVGLTLQTKLEDFLSGWFRQAASQVRDVYPRDISANEIHAILIEKFNQIVPKVSSMVDDAIQRLELIPTINNITAQNGNTNIILDKSSQEILKTIDEIESFLVADKTIVGFKSDLKTLSNGEGLLAISYGIKNCIVKISSLLNNQSIAVFKLSFAREPFSIQLCKNSSSEIANIISLWFRGISQSIIISSHSNKQHTLFIDTGTGDFLSTELPEINLSKSKKVIIKN